MVYTIIRLIWKVYAISCRDTWPVNIRKSRNLRRNGATLPEWKQTRAARCVSISERTWTARLSGPTFPPILVFIHCQFAMIAVLAYRDYATLIENSIFFWESKKWRYIGTPVTDFTIYGISRPIISMGNLFLHFITLLKLFFDKLYHFIIIHCIW